ncbi:hypothetical protein D3C80_1286300 [compost metagenome]
MLEWISILHYPAKQIMRGIRSLKDLRHRVGKSVNAFTYVGCRICRLNLVLFAFFDEPPFKAVLVLVSKRCVAHLIGVVVLDDDFFALRPL